jgi:hypothetical protein
MLTHITILHGPYDIDCLEYELSIGYLVGESGAMYVGDGKLWLLRVKRAELPLVYTIDSASWSLGETDDGGDIIIPEVCEKLRNMTAFDFMMNIVMDIDADIEFDLTSA